MLPIVKCKKRFNAFYIVLAIVFTPTIEAQYVETTTCSLEEYTTNTDKDSSDYIIDRIFKIIYYVLNCWPKV